MNAAAAKILLLLTFLLVICKALQAVQGAPTTASKATENTTNSDFIYRRYVRRRPSQYPNDLYIDEYFEVYTVRRKRPTTPNIQLLSDDEVDRIIRCDFDPQLKECEELHMAATEPPTNTISNVDASTTKEFINAPEATTHIVSSTAIPLTTASNFEASTLTYLTSTPMENIPFLPDIPASAEETTVSSYNPEDEKLDQNIVENEVNVDKKDDEYDDGYEDNTDDNDYVEDF